MYMIHLQFADADADAVCNWNLILMFAKFERCAINHGNSEKKLCCILSKTFAYNHYPYQNKTPSRRQTFHIWRQVFFWLSWLSPFLFLFSSFPLYRSFLSCQFGYLTAAAATNCQQQQQTNKRDECSKCQMMKLREKKKKNTHTHTHTHAERKGKIKWQSRLAKKKMKKKKLKEKGKKEEKFLMKFSTRMRRAQK